MEYDTFVFLDDANFAKLYNALQHTKDKFGNYVIPYKCEYIDMDAVNAWNRAYPNTICPPKGIRIRNVVFWIEDIKTQALLRLQAQIRNSKVLGEAQRHSYES